MSLVLRARDAAGLDAVAKSVSDPASANYRKFLTGDQIAAQFGPSTGAVDAVASFLRSKKLPVDESLLAAGVIKTSGTVSALQDAFATQLSLYRNNDGKVFVGNDSSPKVPAQIQQYVQTVVGLDQAPTPRPSAVGSPAQAVSAAPGAGATQAGSPVGAAPGGGFTPAQLRAAYGATGLNAAGFDGRGVQITLEEQSPFSQADVDQWRAYYGMPKSAVRVIPVDGGATATNSYNDTLEVEGDIEAVYSAAPAADVVVYSLPYTYQGIVDAYAQMIKDKVRIASTSWIDGCESTAASSFVSSLDQVLATAAAQGQTTFAASGDWGASGCLVRPTGSSAPQVDYPASDPNVTAVGATILYVNPDGSRANEITWNDMPNYSTASGGGSSQIFAHPSWQVGSGTKPSLGRQVPDIASVGARQWSFYLATSGPATAGWYICGGTSFATPFTAGLVALISQAGAGAVFGNIDPVLYQNPWVLNNITQGNNSVVGNPSVYSAGPGYNMTTGLGTINTLSMLPVLLGSAAARSIPGLPPIPARPSSPGLPTAPAIN